MEYMISTHTPSWGVTGVYLNKYLLWRISTHTPSWGVTFGRDQAKRANSDFYSHALVGRDDYDNGNSYRRGRFLLTRPRGA